jgi:hypothetical protein
MTKENAVAAKIEMSGAWRYSVNFGEERAMRFTLQEKRGILQRLFGT